MISRNGKISTIGGVMMTVIIVGLVVYGNQKEAVASSLPVSAGLETVQVLPVVATLSASDMTASTATLHGTIDSKGTEVTYWFEYSADPLLGQILNRRTPHVVLNTKSTEYKVTADVSSLSNSTKYYYKLVAKNHEDTVRGDRVIFNTK